MTDAPIPPAFATFDPQTQQDLLEWYRDQDAAADAYASHVTASGAEGTPEEEA